MWRDLFLFGQMNWSSIFIASIWAAVFTVIGVFVYNQLKPKFAELI
jgi:ABC-type polysaccharide/polyol phosphate export permease